MRRIARAACILALIGIAPHTAFAHTASTTVHVTLRVTDACKIGAPTSPPVDATGKVTLALESVLSGCSDRDVPAELTIAADTANGGSYVATVDF